MRGVRRLEGRGEGGGTEEIRGGEEEETEEIRGGEEEGTEEIREGGGEKEETEEVREVEEERELRRLGEWEDRGKGEGLRRSDNGG